MRPLAFTIVIAAALAALLAAPAAGQGQTQVVVDAEPRAGGQVVIQSSVMSGAIPSYPYVFTVPDGTQITFAVQANPGYKLFKWLVNNETVTGPAITVTATGGRVTVTAVFGPAAQLQVMESTFGKIYVSTDGYVWVELKPLQLTIGQVDQRIGAYITVGGTWVNATVSTPFGLNRTATVLNPTYNLTLYNLCGKTCYPVTFYAYLPTGALAATVTVTDGSRTLPWQNGTAILIVEVSGERYGPFLVASVGPAAPISSQLAPYVGLIPIAFLVALGVRSSLRDAAFGVAAYTFLSSALYTAFGVPRAAVPTAAVGLVTAAVMLLLDLRGK